MTGTQRAGDMSADVTKLNFLANASIEATTKDAKDLRAAAPNLRPSSVFIPWLPGETFARRLEATCAVAQQGFSPVVHIPARRLTSQQDLQTQLSQLNAKAGASHLLLIGGDPATPLGPYPDTISVIRDLDLTAFNIKRVSLAGHPEDHPNMSRDQTLDVLHEKIAALSQRGIETEIVTQFSFDPDLVAAWVTTLRKSGLTCDIAIGVPGPTNVPKLMKFATRCGVGASAKAVAKYGFSLSRLFGKAGPDKFIDRFLQLQPDDRSLRAHFYPFGGFAETAAWLETQTG